MTVPNELIAKYRALREEVRTCIRESYPYLTVVVIDNQEFKGTGVVVPSAGLRPDCVAVRLSNDLIRQYEADTIVTTLEPSEYPDWITKERK